MSLKVQSADFIFNKNLFLDVGNVREREENSMQNFNIKKRILDIRFGNEGRDCCRNGFLWYTLPVLTRRIGRFDTFSKNFTIKMLKTKLNTLKGLEVGRGREMSHPCKPSVSFIFAPPVSILFNPQPPAQLA